MHLTTGATTVYSWDHRNRLVKVAEYASEADADLEQNSLQTVEHTYDAFNQWIGRTVDPDGDQGTTPVEQTFFLYDQGQIVLQFDKTGTGDATTSDLTHRYLWSNAVDQLLADEDATGEVLWALTDHLNTIRDLAEYNAATDTTTIVNHRTYDAFGKLTSETNPAFQTAFGFTGRIFESYTGLQNNLHRWYDFQTGRWISEDPIGFEAGDANFYRYVGNSSVFLTDPTGLVELESTESWRGHKGGKSGTFVQTTYYERTWRTLWLVLEPRACGPSVGPITFYPDDIPETPDLGGLGSRGLRGKFQKISNAAAVTGEVVETGVTAAIVFGIPGPEDVVIAAAGRVGYEVIKVSGKWAIRQGSRLLSGADEARAIVRIGAEIEAGIISRLAAGAAPDRNGLTKAGRALEKHGSRPGSVFPLATGNIPAKNSRGQGILEGILRSDSQGIKKNRFGGDDIFDNNTGRGVRYDGNGIMMGFLEP